MVVTGMLNRPDGKKLPLAFLPNAQYNDVAATFSIESVERGLDYIIKG